MALAIDGSSPASFSTASTVSITSSSFTPPSGSLIAVLFAGNSTASSDSSIASITNTGTATTWSRRARKNNNASSDGGVGQPGGAEIWSATAPGGAITVTITGVGTGAGTDKWAAILVFTGADTTTFPIITAANASGLPSATLASCLAGSYVVAVACDWNQAGLGTAGSGQTIVAEYNNTGQISSHSWRTTSTLSANGSQTMNLTAPSAEDYNECVMEVRDSGGAAAPTVVNLWPITGSSIRKRMLRG